MAGCGCDDIGCDSGQKLMPIDEALALLLNNANPITETEKLPLSEAQGRFWQKIYHQLSKCHRMIIARWMATPCIALI